MKKCNNLKNTLLPIFFCLFGICNLYTASAQRIVNYDDFPKSYFDSIRALVYDTAKENYTIQAYRLGDLDEEMKIDGVLAESVWAKAEHRGGLLEKEPFPLVPMSEETEFAILYDDENLYLGVWCWDSEPEKIVQELSPRGTSGPDHLQIFFDSFHDHRTGYKMTVSPTGVQVDELRYDDIKRDNNWNGVWYSEGSVDEKGWYAEIKIPFYNFRYSGEAIQTWGFNIMRNISKNASRGQWKPHLPEWDNTTRMSQLGHIENISNIRSGRTFELRPYGVVGTSKTQNTESSNLINLGGDIRYSPTPNLTADFTLNPDFAQVDADVYEINLTRFPTRFKELRPFFTERINIFNTPIELFYSRRIGSKGSILGGAKMTGKLKHGIEFGVLANRTGGSVFSNSELNNEKATFGVFRVKKDIFGTGNIGVLAAAKEGYESFNRIVGVDGNFLLSKKDLVDFQVASGSTEDKYSENLAYNLTYTHTDDLWGAKFNVDRVEPAFDINRIGYIPKEKDRGWNKGAALIRFSPRINKHHIRRITTNLNYEYSQDLFTSRYINTWLDRYPDFVPDKSFGNIEQDNHEHRAIGEGTRESNNYMIGGDVLINLINEMSLLTEYKYFTATELTGDFSGEFLEMTYSTRPLNTGARYLAVLAASGGTFYNFDQKKVGSQKGFSVTGSSRLGRNALTKLQGGFTKTYDGTAKNDGQYFNISSNSTWMFTKDFFIRLHVQGIFGTTYYTQKETVNDYLLSCLVSWEYRPGSFMYLGYNEGRFDELNPVISNRLGFKNRTLIFKVSYFFSI